MRVEAAGGGLPLNRERYERVEKGEGDRVSGNTGIKEKVWHGERL